MKIIKTFEKFNKKLYWKIPTTSEKYIIALKKLNMPKELIIYFSDVKFVENFAFVRHGDLEMYSKKWGISDTEKIYKESDFKYAGEIEVYDYEVDAEKYNL